MPASPAHQISSTKQATFPASQPKTHPNREAANAEDPILTRIEHKVRVPTLMGRRSETGGAVTYTFDIHLQGEDETIFFDI